MQYTHDEDLKLFLLYFCEYVTFHSKYTYVIMICFVLGKSKQKWDVHEKKTLGQLIIDQMSSTEDLRFLIICVIF